MDLQNISKDELVFSLLDIEEKYKSLKSLYEKDIAELKLTEEKSIKLTKAVEHSPASVIITDKTGKIEYVNPRFIEISGYSADEVIGKNPRILKSGKLPQSLYNELWHELLAGREWQGEFQNKKKNGELYWEYASLSSIKNSNGYVTHFIAVKEDITERKKSNELLKQSEEKYRIIAENTSDVIWIMNLESKRFTYISPSITNLTGYTVAEFMNKTITDAVDSKSAIFIINILPERIKKYYNGNLSEKTKVNDVKQSCKDGSFIWTEISTTLMTDNEGKVTDIIGVSRDIEQRKISEIKIQQQNIELDIFKSKINDSLNYAKIIQEAVIPTEETLNKHLNNSFILYLPKDVVSGDFYWLYKKNDSTIIAVADCTGHGIPGAFLSMMGITMLNDIIKGRNIELPSEILTALNENINSVFNQGNDLSDDGMEITIISINKKEKKIILSSTNQSVCFIKNNIPQIIDGEIYSIGGLLSKRIKPEYKDIEIYINEPFSIYLYSDGLQDQICKESKNKFGIEKMKKLFLKINHNASQIKKNKIIDELNLWKGNNKQTDDITILGLDFL